MGDAAGALAELDRSLAINPQSHRRLARRGALLGASATSPAQLEASRRSLEQALRLNQEETGTLMLLAETTLARGEFAEAEQQCKLACRANPRAAGALFFRAYVRWAGGDEGEARPAAPGSGRCPGKTGSRKAR